MMLLILILNNVVDKMLPCRTPCESRIKCKKKSIGVNYFVIPSDCKSFHMSNTLGFKVFQDVLFSFCFHDRISYYAFRGI